MHKPVTILPSPSKAGGFTLVELLIAIVVIAILAAISIVAFNGVQDRALKSSLSSALSGTKKRLELDKVMRGNFSPSLSEIQGSDHTDESGVEYQYTSDGSSFCLTGSLEKFSMHTSSSLSGMQDGVCAGHDVPITGPVTDPVVHLQTGSFDGSQPASGGLDVPVQIEYNLEANDYVFVLFNANYRTNLIVQDDSDTQLTKLYEKSMGSLGGQKHVVFGVGGLTGQQTININACWSVSCTYENGSVKAAYAIYVIRGLGSSPTFAATETDYGVQPGHNNTVAPASQNLAKRKLAIFSYVYYGSIAPTEADASTPSLSWATDSSAPNNHLGTALAARHAYAETNTIVQYQMTMPSQYSHYHGSVLFTLQ